MNILDTLENITVLCMSLVLCVLNIVLLCLAAYLFGSSTFEDRLLACILALLPVCYGVAGNALINKDLRHG